MKRNMTCIICPFGCEMTVEVCENGIIEVSGNTCPKGREYAQLECTNPVRTVTTTVKCADGSLLPVKTDVPVSKSKIYDVIKIASEVIIPLPIKAGDVIISDVCGCNIVATANKG